MFVLPLCVEDAESDSVACDTPQGREPVGGSIVSAETAVGNPQLAAPSRAAVLFVPTGLRAVSRQV